jgi:hypothetical protein
LIWLGLLAALIAAPAHAREWNLYTPCDGLELTHAQAQDFASSRLCEPEALGALHRAFGAPPLASIARSGRAVRVSVVDGEGRSIVSIDAARRGSRMFAIVRGAADQRRRPTMRRTLPEGTWDYIEKGAARLANTRAVAPIYDRCRGGLSVFVETHGFGEARTLRGKACDGGAAFVYGRTIGDLVFAASDCAEVAEAEFAFRRLKACVED